MRTALALAAALPALASAFSPSSAPNRAESTLKARSGWERRSDLGPHSPIETGSIARTSSNGGFIGAPKSHLRDFDRRVNGSGHEIGAPGDDWFRASRGGRDLAGGRVSSYSGPWTVAGSSATGSTVGSAHAAISPAPPAADDGGRRPIVAGNWKLNPATADEARGLLEGLAANFAGAGMLRAYGPEVVIFPPLPYLSDALHMLRGTGVGVGAQNCSPHESGAFTGEVAPSMLASAGCSHVLLGHSERRTLFGETDERINECLLRCLDQPTLTVVLCVGETLEEYENGLLEAVVDNQIRGGLRGVDPAALRERVVVAYEPVWAIGTGLVATPEQAQAAHVAIRNSLQSLYGSGEVARSVRIQYGGSVTPTSIEELMWEDDVDGALVGGASLDAESFARIVAGAAEAHERKCAGAH